MTDDLANSEAAASAESGSEELAPRATLTLRRSGADTDFAFPIQGRAVIGRFDPSVGPIDVDLGGLDEGKFVSRRHAEIWYEPHAWFVKDLGSSNGTYLLRNDFERVDFAELSDGDEVAFGNARFVFRVAEQGAEEASAEAERPPGEEESAGGEESEPTADSD
jgi:pSer/pThr/pTyr-binding forkhead associated (FHA) protein